MRQHPDFLHNLRAEVANLDQWRDRVVVIGFAVLAGLAVVLLTWLADHALQLFHNARAHAWWLPLVWTPLCTVVVLWAVQRWAPGASGSGVPQVLAALSPEMPPQRRGLFVSLRLSLAKILGVSGGVLAGLSLGRQGPSVQVAAGVMLHARRYLSAHSVISERELLVAGGAAGIAAAFNTPLGGIVFAIEELARRLEARSSGLMLVAIVVAGLVAVSIFGNLSYFGRVHAEVAQWWTLLLPGLLVAAVCGLLGGLLARLLLTSITGMPRRLGILRRRYPLRFAAGCALVVACIGTVGVGHTFGSGHDHTALLLARDGDSGALPLLFTLLKFVATWMSVWTGVPGGVFAPGLSLGASVGADMAWLFGLPHANALIAVGMAAFLAAVTQTPITAMIIVMEMTDGHAMVLSLMAGALVASGISRMISAPLNSTLATLMLQGALASVARQSMPQPEAEPPVEARG